MFRLTPGSLRFSVLVLIGLLVLSPACSLAGMTPEEVKKFNDYKAMAEKVGNGEFDNIARALGKIGLGYCYAKGEGVVQDYVKAVLWYRKAAEQGNASAQYYLGVCYFNSAGVAQDNVHAVYWTRKAAEQGNETAQLSLGWCYYNGEGVAKDVVEAYAYFSLAGKAHALGSKHLGFIESEISAAKIAAGKKRTIELQKEIEAKIAAKKAGK